MKLQLALDRPDLAREMELVSSVARYVDLIEAGTPLLIREGIRAVRELRRRFRGRRVVADIKVVDAGEPIAELAFAAGASVVTVLGCAADTVIERVVRSAKRYDGEVMADSLGVEDIQRRARELRKLGVSSLCLNRRGFKQAKVGRQESHKHLVSLIEEIDLPVFLAGGIDLSELVALRQIPLAGVIIGAAIAEAESPEDVARQMRQVIGESD
ncbi:MAG TPA: orotidine 5'-phosphate decarboxylase / HUMPS family protein [Blastocatellia bacterium]|nr:orotidine 5'-phosphate decarboxylase / HUMPS family protein [Blastocatellia bacterium]